jgi:hypothetical protein
LEEVETIFGIGSFGGQVQRRGAHVSTLEIGSRGAETCFGGIQRFYAELRREFGWGNLSLGFFGVLGGGPRAFIEEGGLLVVLVMGLGEF